MSEKAKSSRLGLPWPETYDALRPLIQEQWGVGQEIYLNRKLSGKSGALVYAADVTSSDFTGQAILKLDRAPDPAWQEKSEAERHSQAFQLAPDYAAQHLPKILHTLHHGETIAILSTIAGRGLTYAVPWAQCAYKDALGVGRQLYRGLLEDWNRDHELAPGMVTPSDLLQGWLAHRLDPQRNRLHGFLADHCGLAPDQPSFSFEGHWYPNPLAFAAAPAAQSEPSQLRAVVGNVHGDLHGYNVLVDGRDRAEAGYYLIDLALFKPRQFLFFDHGYFEISCLLMLREQVNAVHWESVLDNLKSFHHPVGETVHRSDDIGLIALIKALRREALDWVDRHQANRLSYMESQYQLARVAAGLNFANKPLSDKARRMAFLYAAANLKDYLSLNNTDWPKHGPPFTLDGQPLAAGVDPSVPEQPHPPLPHKPSIAVLAFENLSGDPDQEYFADGVAQDIITDLSRIDWLMVISRGTTFTYKGQAVEPKRIGRELGVHYLVEGSVRKAGTRARVSVQLVDATNGHQVWAERYDRELDDIFALQEDIAEAITANIDTQLRVAERERARRKHGHISAWDKFQRAMWHMHRFTSDDTETARQQMFGLINEVPSFAGAFALLAFIDTRSLLFNESERPEDTLARAYDHATKAVALDEGNSLARVALSRVYAFQGNYERSIEEAETAVALNPSSSLCHIDLGTALIWSGRAEEGLAAIEMSIRLSPKGPLLKLKLFSQGVALYLLGRDLEAEGLMRQVIYGPATMPFGHMILAAILVRQERLDEARAAVVEALQIRPTLSLSLIRNSWRNLCPAYMEMLTHDLRQAGMPE